TADYFGKASALLLDDYFPNKNAQSYGWAMFTDKEPFEGCVTFDQQPELKELIIQCATYYRFGKNNLDNAQVFGSNNKEQWKLIDQIKYKKDKRFTNKYAINLKLKNTQYKYYKIKVTPGRNRRFFVSQLFFY
ncbi:hypothetical protein, partial [Ochrovirga pacifica]|uniref:hypothetical protein n=1 Tax=Ochrovirga pacifica TaxID=1042376 RepID=UPI0002559FEB